MERLQVDYGVNLNCEDYRPTTKPGSDSRFLLFSPAAGLFNPYYIKPIALELCLF